MAITRYHSELTLLDDHGNQNIIYPKTTISDVYTDSKSGITISSKLDYYGVCMTPFAETLKKVSIPGFKLTDGVHVSIRLQGDGYNTECSVDSESWSLQINTLIACPIVLGVSNTNGAIIFRENSVLDLVFDGTASKFFQINSNIVPAHSTIGDRNADTFYLSSTNANDSKYNYVRCVYKHPNIYIKRGVLYSPYFAGDGSNLTNINAANISNGTITTDRLPTISGLTPATYGDTSVKTLVHGGIFYVPKINVNSKGLITEISNVELTLPSTYDGNSATASKLAASVSIRIGNSSKYFDGSKDVSWSLSEIGAASNNHSHNYAGSSSDGGAATSASKLEVSRTLTIGNTGKAFNGSANVSWSLSEIGAAEAVHTHYYAGSTSIGGPANSAGALINSNAWGTNETLRVQYAQSLNGSCTQYDNIACLVNGFAASGTTGTDKTYYLHYASLDDILNVHNIGKTVWMYYQVTPVLGEFSFTLTRTNSSDLVKSGGSFILPAGTWIILESVSVPSQPGIFAWHLKNADATVIGKTQRYHKSMSNGIHQIINGHDIITITANTQISIIIDNCPTIDSASTNPYFGFDFSAIKIR